MNKIFALYKMNFLEYTALCILKKVVSEDTVIIPVSMEKYIETPALLGDLRGLINSSTDDTLSIIILNSYTTSPMEKLLNSLDEKINKLLLLPKQAEKRGISNISLVKYNDDNYLDKLLDGLKLMPNLNIIDDHFSKLRLLTSNFKSTNSTTLVAKCLLDFKDMYTTENDAETRIELLKSVYKFDSNINEDIGVYLSLIINYKKLDSYYNWMCRRLTRQLKSKDFNSDFFTKNEIGTMYSSLDARIYNLNEACANCEIKKLMRKQEQGEITDYVYYIMSENSSKALNTVYLMLFSEEENCSIVSCGNNFSIVTKFEGEDKSINHIKHKMLRYAVPISDINKVI